MLQLVVYHDDYTIISAEKGLNIKGLFDAWLRENRKKAGIVSLKLPSILNPLKTTEFNENRRKLKQLQKEILERNNAKNILEAFITEILIKQHGCRRLKYTKEVIA